MANPILKKKGDKELAKAIKTAFADKRFSIVDLGDVLKSAMDGNAISDVEYRDLKRFMRTETRLGLGDRLIIEHFLALNYPMDGPFVYPGTVDDLDGKNPVGNLECAALVQVYQERLGEPVGLAATWREGIKVRNNDHLIERGTAVATFEDGFYPNRGDYTDPNESNHVAYYLSQDSEGIEVMDQFTHPNKPKISPRLIKFRGQRSNGLYNDPSNNGDALSVIMRKMNKRK